LHYLDAQEIRFGHMPKTSDFSLGIRRDNSDDLSPGTDHNVDIIPIHSRNRDTNPNSLVGMTANSWKSLGEPWFDIYFVSIQRMRLMDTLARLNRMVICPGGWAVPQ
jgi:hypothetical protein